ncbi:MAG: hypothetical protein FJ026_06005 [Chloroflexi bacterium]|nr:hypothetical protein [Chloroflexota bacterium]
MCKRAYVLLAVLILVMASGCGGGGRRATRQGGTGDSSLPTATVVAAVPTTARPRATNTLPAPPPTATRRLPTSTPRPPTATPVPPTPTPPKHRAITFNDYVPEQKNYVDVICVVVNFAGKPDRVFDLRKYWDKIFGLQDPIRQLNAYYKEDFYGQLELGPFSTPQMGAKGYIEVTLPGVAKDYSFGWLIGMESPDIPSLDPAAVQKLTLAIMAAAVEKHPEVNFQDKYILVVMNAPGSEYGRGRDHSRRWRRVALGSFCGRCDRLRQVQVLQ